MFSKESATYIPRIYLVLILAASLVVIGTTASLAQSYFFSTGSPDGKMATASRQVPFIGLAPAGSELSDVTEVVVEIYRLFPDDSVKRVRATPCVARH